MAYVTHNDAPPHVDLHGATGRFHSTLAAAVDRFAAFLAARRMHARHAAELRMLAAMDDRSLADIGVTRADVWREQNLA